jgi:glutamyl-tRNA synthetase
MREEQQKNKKPPRYDRACRNLSEEEVEKKIKAGESYVIRQKMPLKGDVVIHDELRGDIKFRAEELDDHVLIKTNGMPTYQFAVVVDDHLMEITHVTRSDEWIPSFPKNVLLYKSFGWEVPKFIHFPVVLNKEGGKLSKRQGSVSVEDFKDQGYLKEALINFVSLLGWHPEGDNEILSLEDLIAKFNYQKINTSPAIFDTEKLDYFNGYYIRNMNLDELTLMAKSYLEDNIKLSSKAHKKTLEFLKSVVRIEQERLKKISDIKDLTEFLFVNNLDYEKELLVWKKNTLEDAQDNLKKIIVLLEKIPEENWTNDSLEDAIITWLKAQELKIGDYLWPMRVALSGKKASPGPFEIAEVLGKKESLERIRRAIGQ